MSPARALKLKGMPVRCEATQAAVAGPSAQGAWICVILSATNSRARCTPAKADQRASPPVSRDRHHRTSTLARNLAASGPQLRRRWARSLTSVPVAARPSRRTGAATGPIPATRAAGRGP